MLMQILGTLFAVARKKIKGKDKMRVGLVVMMVLLILPVTVVLVGQKTGFFSKAAGPGTADARFGLGVATHGGSGYSDDFGNTTINQNKIDALAVLGLNPAYKTWSVFQLESNSYINFFLASYNSYPSYSQFASPNSNTSTGYTENNWNTVSSTSTGVPGVGTFVVTHIALYKVGNSYSDQNLCGSDKYCVYGLAGQPTGWGQDTGQAGGQYLNGFPNQSNKASYCRIPVSWRKYFYNPSGINCGDAATEYGYSPVGMMSINGADLYSPYPSYGPMNIHDIKPPIDYWRNNEADSSANLGKISGHIVYGGLYNPKSYKGKSYAEGALTYFIKTNPGKTYVLFNFPNARIAKWDGNPVYAESYSWLGKNFMVDYVKAKDTSSKIQVHVLNDMDLQTYLNNMIYDYKYSRGWGNFPTDYWGIANYKAQNDPGYGYPASPDDVLYGLTYAVEKQVKILTGLASVNSHEIRLLEVTAGGANVYPIPNQTVYSRISGAANSTYNWEKNIYYRFGKWLKSLSAAYPNLTYYSVQPTFNIPEYMDNSSVPARYTVYPPSIPRTYGNQVLSTNSTGAAEGWSQAAQPGASVVYIKNAATMSQNTCGTHIETQYFSEDGITHATEGVGEIQIVINTFPDWAGSNVTNSATKYGVRAMYTPIAFGPFAANTGYVYEGSCATGCVYGWRPVAINTWYKHATLGFKMYISPIVTGKQATLRVDVRPLAGSPLLNKNLNLYAYAEKVSQSVYDGNAKANLFDPSAGNGSKYDFARFKKLRTVNLSTNCVNPPAG